MKYLLIFTFSFFLSNSYGQSFATVGTFKELEKEYFIENDTTYVINFWATWCKPCVRELPFLESLHAESKDKNIKVILVSLDFDKQINSHFKPFLTKNKISSTVLLLKDKNYNDWVEKLDPSWAGSIPATLVINGAKRAFYEGEFHSVNEIKDLISKTN